MRSTVAFILAAVFALQAHAATFVGCYNGVASLPAFTVPQIGFPGPLSNCLSYCSSYSYNFAYYAASSKGCWCGSVSPYAMWTQAGNPSTCTSGIAGYSLKTTFQGPTCVTSFKADPKDNGSPSSQVNDIGQCFQNCRSYIYAISYANGAVTNGYNCYCANQPPTLGSGATCDMHTYNVFQHTGAQAQASLARRRADIEQREQEQLALAVSPHCPLGYDACKVALSEEAGYECIRAESELESCGGCRFGHYGVPGLNATHARGVDCTALPGVHPHGVTCNQGRCVASACKRGFRLSGGRCF